jgi:hypothetical protein
MKRQPPKSKAPRSAPGTKPMTLREWWVSVAKYEGQCAQKRPPWLVVP